MQGFAVPAVVMLGVALSFPAAGRAQDGDAAKGKQIFARCQVCHSLEADTNKLGPSLHGIIGRPAASVEGFTYSDAMKESGLTWDDATLGEYLASPRKVVPGTRMVFPGLPKAEDRANVIAYLKEAGGAAE